MLEKNTHPNQTPTTKPNRQRLTAKLLCEGQSEPDLERTTMDSIAIGTTTRCRKTNPTAADGLSDTLTFLARDDFTVFWLWDETNQREVVNMQ